MFVARWIDFIILPIVMLALLPWQPGGGYWLFVLGAVTWTLVEYAVHRALHHPRLYRFHQPHHARPDEPGVSWIASSIIGFSLGAIAWAVPPLIPAFDGLAVGYLFYVFMHTTAHLYPKEGVGDAPAFHAAHHRRPTVNFGVSTPLWDHLFRTARL